jgi:hypothetical protein
VHPNLLYHERNLPGILGKPVETLRFAPVTNPHLIDLIKFAGKFPTSRRPSPYAAIS